jgi:predicted TPR repeat methyltransferase
MRVEGKFMAEKSFLKDAYKERNDTETRTFYDEWAPSYDDELMSQNYQQPQRCAVAMAGLLDPGPGVHILDVGCGSGLSGRALRAAGFSAIDGCDFSPGMLDEAKATGAYDQLFETNLNAPPMNAEDGAYDGAACVGVFSFGHVQADALYDILRVIRAGGALVIGINDKFYKEGSLTAKLDALAKDGRITGRRDEHGDHIRGTGATGWVITAHKAA